MSVEAIRGLSSDALRVRLPELLVEPLDDPPLSASLRSELAELVESWSASEAASVLDAVSEVGDERRVHTANPVLRSAARAWCRRVLAGSTLDGGEHLSQAVAEGPTAVVCNHQSYIDSNAIDSTLYHNALEGLANRLVSAAGPKVYEGLFRRVVSASLNTLPVPQSATLDHTARVPVRDLARQALRAVKHAHAAMREGRVLLMFPEGARTRTRRMQPFLPAVYRYFTLPGARVVPAALIGTAEVMGVGEQGIRPLPCSLRFGAPIDVAGVGGARIALDQAQRMVSRLLPPELRPEDPPESGP